MNEEGRAHRGEPALQGLVEKFETMVEHSEQAFFDVDELEGLIEHYLEQKSIRKAHAVARYARQLYPTNLALKLKHAQICIVSGQGVKAVPLLKELLDIEPLNEEVLITLGSVYSQMSEHKLAIDCFKRALVFADRETKREIRIDIALEFENLGSWHEAIRNLHAALEEDAMNETAVYELAFCYERTEQFKQAALFYEQFLEKQPYSFAAWYSMGNALQQCGRYTRAIDAYDFAIAIESAFGPAYHQKAEALVAMERYQDALHTYEETLSFEEPSPSTRCYMGECLERIGDLDRAEEYYRESLKLDPQFADAFVGLGILSDMRGRLSTACSYFEQALKIEPKHADYHLLLATCLKKREEHDRAEEIYTKGLLLDIQHEELWLERVDNLQLAVRHEDALLVIDDGLAALQNAPKLSYRRFISQYALGQHKAAFDLLELLLTNHYDQSEILLNFLPALANDARYIERIERFKL